MSRRGITAGREQRRVHLLVVIETHGHESGEGVVGIERELQRGVAARCRARHRGDITHQTRLLTVGEVETQVQVVVEAP